jgi:hypothetical protein
VREKEIDREKERRKKEGTGGKGKRNEGGGREGEMKGGRTWMERREGGTGGGEGGGPGEGAWKFHVAVERCVFQVEEERHLHR